MTPAGKAWAALAGGVLAYELIAVEGQLLSEGVDRALERAPILTHAAVIVTALHLLNVFDRAGLTRLDPYAQLPLIKRRWQRTEGAQ